MMSDGAARVRLQMAGYARLDNDSLVHCTAIVAHWVRLGENCIVHPFAVVGRVPDTSRALARQPECPNTLFVGNNVKIGCHSTLYADVEIGDDTLIGDYASIREGSRIGARCVIGRQVMVNYGARISDDCRFQDTTHITGHCEVGEGCFFGPGVMTSNDRNVTLGENYHYPEPQPPIFGARVMIGAGANILAGVRIGDDALIGAGALIVKNVPGGAKMLGMPATLRRIYAPGEQQAEALSDARMIFDNCTTSHHPV